eukprot:2699104-Prymnesium_polylepis.2
MRRGLGAIACEQRVGAVPFRPSSRRSVPWQPNATMYTRAVCAAPRPEPRAGPLMGCGSLVCVLQCITLCLS